MRFANSSVLYIGSNKRLASGIMNSPTNFKVMVFQSSHDYCFFIMHNEECFLTLLTYVNDVLITGTSEEAIVKVKKFLHKQWYMICQLLSSPRNCSFLKDAGLLGAKAVITSMPKGLKFKTITLICWQMQKIQKSMFNYSWYYLCHSIASSIR